MKKHHTIAIVVGILTLTFLSVLVSKTTKKEDIVSDIVSEEKSETSTKS